MEHGEDKVLLYYEEPGYRDYWVAKVYESGRIEFREDIEWEMKTEDKLRIIENIKRHIEYKDGKAYLKDGQGYLTEDL